MKEYRAICELDGLCEEDKLLGRETLLTLEFSELRDKLLELDKLLGREKLLELDKLLERKKLLFSPYYFLKLYEFLNQGAQREDDGLFTPCRHLRYSWLKRFSQFKQYIQARTTGTKLKHESEAWGNRNRNKTAKKMDFDRKTVHG